ncbi:MAG: alpha/beta hydrolase [Phycisphaerales bacterium]|nr:MAG: alpha/beta hydrolase [Phycisphaerales bacterium]
MRCFFLSLMIVSVLAGCEQSRKQVRPVPYADWESASVTSNGVRIHYWRTGGVGKPVMIMAHGVTDYGLNWASLAAKFQADYDIIMYDARGHGFSEKPQGPYDLATHVEDLAGLVKALGIEKPILIGHSMGSGTVALAGATYPDLPRAVIMEDPALSELLKYLTEVNIPEWKRLIEADKAMGKQRLMKLARSKRHPGWSDFEYDHWAEAKLLVSSNVVDVIRDEGLRNPNRIYPKIMAPTLILKADADEESRRKHIEIAGLLPNGKLVHIDGAGHLVRLDRPAETERQIRDFLAGLD